MNSFRAYLISLSLLIGVAALWVANAQAVISSVGFGSVETRMSTLERVSSAQAQLLQQLQQQLIDNQADIDRLRGQIQENTYQLNQVVERQKQIYQRMDSFSSTPPPPSASNNTIEVEDIHTKAASASTQSDNANASYNAAIVLVLEKKQYDQAISAFQVFIKKFPDSTYQPNAYYWLGQLSYNRGRKDEASYYFATVAKKYPKSPKSAEALYKVGVIMQEKGDNTKAKAVFQQVIKQYSNSEVAKWAQKRITAL